MRPPRLVAMMTATMTSHLGAGLDGDGAARGWSGGSPRPPGVSLAALLTPDIQITIYKIDFLAARCRLPELVLIVTATMTSHLGAGLDGDGAAMGWSGGSHHPGSQSLNIKLIFSPSDSIFLKLEDVVFIHSFNLDIPA